MKTVSSRKAAKPRVVKPKVSLLESNPVGRVDVMAARLIERFVEMTPNPILKQLHEVTQPMLHGLLKKNLGPTSDLGKTAKRLTS